MKTTSTRKRSVAPPNGTHSRAEIKSVLKQKPVAKKKAAKSSTATEVPPPPFSRETAPHAVTAEARKWLSNERAIYGAGYAPILWVSAPKLWDLAETLGRELTLDEVKFLVQADGDMEQCFIGKAPFQPIRYLVITRVTLDLLKKAGAFEKIPKEKLLWGGAFAINQEGNGLIPLSGARFWNVRGDFALKDSAMVRAWLISNENPALRSWPQSRADAEEGIRRIADAKARARHTHENLVQVDIVLAGAIRSRPKHKHGNKK